MGLPPFQKLTEEDRQIEVWKVKRLIKSLESYKGNGTSMISLVIRPGDQIAQSARLLTEEQGTASNIKSRVNRLSVLSAITSTAQRLKLYTRVPENGLAIYCGTVITEEGREKQVTIDISPFKPINTSLYLCDNKFHTEALSVLLEDEKTFGFIIVNGSGALYATLCGNTRTIYHQFSVDLPKKHRKGGQSSVRFARLRLEKRHAYLMKVAELATSIFISNDKPNVSGIILAGSADFKEQLNRSDLFDQRLRPLVLAILDISYGGEDGLNQAIDLSADILTDVKFVQEKKLIEAFFTEVSIDSGKYCFGVEDVFKAMDMGAAEKVIVWENLEILRFKLFNSSTGLESVKYLTPDEAKDMSHFINPETKTTLDVREKGSLLEWLAEHYRDYGCVLEIITNKSPEGSQFCRGFGGLGALMRWKADFTDHLADEDAASDDDLDDFI